MRHTAILLVVRNLTFFGLALVSLQANAWQPCQLICDTQCIGTEMAIQTIKTLQNFTAVQQSFAQSSEKFSNASQAFTKYGDDVTKASSEVGQKIKDLVITDKPLKSSITGRIVQNIDALNINWEQQMMMYNSTLESTQVSLENQITASINAVLKLIREEYIESQTSHITNQLVENAGEMTASLNNRMAYLNTNLPQTIAYSMAVQNVDGRSSFKAVTKKEAVDHMASLILGVKENSDEDWKSFGYLEGKSASSLMAISDLNSGLVSSDYSEYSDLDHDRIVLGSQIDLQGMQLLKSERNNLLMLQRLRAKNYVSKELNIDD